MEAFQEMEGSLRELEQVVLNKSLSDGRVSQLERRCRVYEQALRWAATNMLVPNEGGKGFRSISVLELVLLSQKPK